MNDETQRLHGKFLQGNITSDSFFSLFIENILENLDSFLHSLKATNGGHVQLAHNAVGSHSLLQTPLGVDVFAIECMTQNQ